MAEPPPKRVDRWVLDVLPTNRRDDFIGALAVIVGAPEQPA